MPNATAEMPVIDLGREIEVQRNKLAQMEQIQQEFNHVQEQVRLILNPVPSNPKIMGAIKKAQKRKGRRLAGDKRLSDVVFEAVMRKGPETQVTINEAIDLAAQAGVQSTSDQPHTVFRQMLQRDKRFKKHRVRGERQVRFGLSHHQ